MSEPAPRPGTADVFALLRADIDQRAEIGWKTYGRPLETFNGRNPAQDAYEEALDLAVYLRQLLEERAVMLDLLRAALRVLPRGQASEAITRTLGADPGTWR